MSDTTQETNTKKSVASSLEIWDLGRIIYIIIRQEMLNTANFQHETWK